MELLCYAQSYIHFRKKYIVARSTALHIAVIQRNKIIINTLMFHKAKLLKNKNGVTALELSTIQNSYDIRGELRKYAKLSNLKI